MMFMEEIKDLRLGEGVSAGDLINQLSDSGLQASELGQAVKVMEKMKKEGSTIYLSFTANLVASGLRGVLAELCRQKFVDVVVTTAGALEHDFIKSFEPYLQGDFDVNDVELHQKKVNRIGNIFVPTERYEMFEEKFKPVLQSLYEEKKVFSPSALAKKMGESLEDEGSILYWCAKNNIPIFCPGITDGAIGLQSFFFKQEKEDFGIDVTGDMKELADLTLNAEKTGAIILGGGISKHHVIGANIVREGLDFAVYFSTASEFDGSLSGARTKEAKSWGKLKEQANAATVYGDASITFALAAAALKEKKLL
jgi:deoxyhypusine synthase